MNILIIEDDEFLSSKIQRLFEKKDEVNIVKVISSFEDFVNYYHNINNFEVILVDIYLWKSTNKDTWIEIIKLIRKKNKYVPIIIISWLNDIWWLRLWFDSWANDYICKPFRLAELEIRVFKWIKDLLKSESMWNKDILEYNWLKYYFKNNTFSFDDNEIKLTKINKTLLLLFLTKKGEILSEIYLIEKIWWDRWDTIDRNLRVTISRLKKALKSYWIDLWISNIRWEWYILKTF